jgi:hypothetical protein
MIIMDVNVRKEKNNRNKTYRYHNGIIRSLPVFQIAFCEDYSNVPA